MITEYNYKAGSIVKFSESDIQWIVLDVSGPYILLLARQSIGCKAFDYEGSSNWGTSSLRQYLNEEWIDTEYLYPIMSDLTADDGSTDYGYAIDKVTLLSCDLYRKYRKLILDKGEYDTRWWTLTPWRYAGPLGALTRFVSNEGLLCCCGEPNVTSFGVVPLVRLDTEHIPYHEMPEVYKN